MRVLRNLVLPTTDDAVSKREHHCWPTSDNGPWGNKCAGCAVSGQGEMAIARWDHPSSRPTRTVHPTIPGRLPPPCWGSRPGVTEIEPEVALPANHRWAVQSPRAGPRCHALDGLLVETFEPPSPNLTSPSQFRSAVSQPGILSTTALADQQPALPILPSRSTLSGA